MPIFSVTAHTAGNDDPLGVFSVTATNEDAAIDEVCKVHDLARGTYSLRVYDTDNECSATKSPLLYATLIVDKDVGGHTQSRRQ